MKKLLGIFIILGFIILDVSAQSNGGKNAGIGTGTTTTTTTTTTTNGTKILTDVLNGAAGAVTGATTGTPTNLQMENGMRDALNQCLKNGAGIVSLKDGFFRNLAIKILFPQEARQVEAALRNLGLGSICDQAILKFNRAAEDASKKATPIFTDALKKITITDVVNILLGPNNAATNYFKNNTQTQLVSSFSPVVNTSLSSVGATQAWSIVTTKYNKLPLVKPVNTNLGQYVTGKAIDGLFYVIAQEEVKVRQNISNRTTPIMRDIFAWVDQQKAGGK